jgi:hypothetical protein
LRGGTDLVHAGEERGEAIAGEAVIDVEATFFGDEDAGGFEEGEVLGNRGEVVPDECAEVANTELPLHECLGEEEPRGVSEGFEDGDAFSGEWRRRDGHACLFGQLAN